MPTQRLDEQVNNAIVHLDFALSLHADSAEAKAVHRRVQHLWADWSRFYHRAVPAEVYTPRYRSVVAQFASRLSKLEAAAESAVGRSLHTLPVDPDADASNRYVDEAQEAATRALQRGGRSLVWLAAAAGVALWLSQRR